MSEQMSTGMVDPAVFVHLQAKIDEDAKVREVCYGLTDSMMAWLMLLSIRKYETFSRTSSGKVEQPEVLFYVRLLMGQRTTGTVHPLQSTLHTLFRMCVRIPRIRLHC